MGIIEEEALLPGWHFYVPGYTQVELYDTKFDTLRVKAPSATRDNQRVDVDVVVSWARDPAKVPMQAEKFPQIQERVLIPRLTEAVKDSVASYTADQLVTERAAVKDQITSKVTGRMDDVGLLISDVSVDQFDLSDEYDAAVERNMQARKRAEEAKEELERTRVEAEKKIAEAEGLRKAKILVARGNAEAYRIEGEALRENPAIAEMEKIHKWSGNPPQVTVSGEGGGVVPFLDISTASGTVSE
tara:strand:- start:5191 stop:5922 length:732 start_codon:yes stop_codon:yes gene_type:complete